MPLTHSEYENLLAFKKRPDSFLSPKMLAKWIWTHRWEKYIVPSGKKIEDMERDSSWRVIWEVPWDWNVHDHQFHQAELVEKYGKHDIRSQALVTSGTLSNGALRRTEYFSIHVTALIHDLGEIDHGDVTYDEKHLAKHTVADEINATRTFIQQALLETHEDKKRGIERLLMNQYMIDADKAHRLHKLFKLYEKFSYLNGALFTFHKGIWVVAHSEYLVHNVLKNQIEPLLQAVNHWIPSAVLFLRERREVIDEMFDWVNRSWFRDKNEDYQRAFEKAQSLWNQYRQNV